MCRHFCYLGAARPLSELVFEPSHSIVVQSYAPADMRGGGAVNADGFGVGWFDAESRAHRYRRAGPIWQDQGLATLAGQVSTTAALAAVRNATAGMPVGETAAAPFTDGRWLFSLNGRIDGWPDTAVPTAGTLPLSRLLSMDAPTDAALIWAALGDRLAGAAEPGRVLAGLVAEILDAAPGSRLNLLLTDGRRAYATTVTHSLWTRTWSDGLLVASEPLDDRPGWQPVPEGQLVTAGRDGIEVTALTGSPSMI